MTDDHEYAEWAKEAQQGHYATEQELRINLERFEEALREIVAGKHLDNCKCVRAAEIQYADGTYDAGGWSKAGGCYDIARVALGMGVSPQ